MKGITLCFLCQNSEVRKSTIAVRRMCALLRQWSKWYGYHTVSSHLAA